MRVCAMSLFLLLLLHTLSHLHTLGLRRFYATRPSVRPTPLPSFQRTASRAAESRSGGEQRKENGECAEDGGKKPRGSGPLFCALRVYTY